MGRAWGILVFSPFAKREKLGGCATKQRGFLSVSLRGIFLIVVASPLQAGESISINCNLHHLTMLEESAQADDEASGGAGASPPVIASESVPADERSNPVLSPLPPRERTTK